MKKIMFNDKYGLTKAVLDGRKTQTRRIINPQPTLNDMSGITWKGCSYGINSYPSTDNGSYYNFIKTLSYNKYFKGYKVGEVVAVSQCYLDINNPQFDKNGHDVAGNTNKMFVKAELMPRKIRITSIGIERLQDISNEDSLKEGIIKSTYRQADGNMGCYYWHLGVTNKNCPYGQYIEYNSPREAYASLMDEISGKGTWDSNPYVFVYEFELIK